jgi:predicted metal-dependent HD superfamily phosphohydrolase
MRTHLTSWMALWHRIGAHGDGTVWHQKLHRAYQDQHRFYHTLQHLEECLQQFDIVASQHNVACSPAMELALWFHDAVYDVGASNNEEQSAQLARFVLLKADVDSSLIDDTCRLVMATKTHNGSLPDEECIADIDLSILGQTPSRFQEYERQIRQEYAMIDETLYCTKRSEIMASFLNRPRLYKTRYFCQHFEEQARLNLEWLLLHLAKS